MQRIAYKIVKRELWESQLKSSSKFIGTPLDLKDGYIHLSAKEQVRETASKWFKGEMDLIMICIDLTRVDGEVKWEPSRNNQLFPHVYGTLSTNCVRWIHDLLLTPNKDDFIYPQEFDG